MCHCARSRHFYFIFCIFKVCMCVGCTYVFVCGLYMCVWGAVHVEAEQVAHVGSFPSPLGCVTELRLSGLAAHTPLPTELSPTPSFPFSPLSLQFVISHYHSVRPPNCLCGNHFNWQKVSLAFQLSLPLSNQSYFCDCSHLTL